VPNGEVIDVAYYKMYDQLITGIISLHQDRKQGLAHNTDNADDRRGF